ncbi:tRNA pseudouridine synthase B [Singulisphaera sp. GP187]|uniref:tRNA pseudouridine(55) synthase TruB n=1 Tax=Singulisphaera sp. GP187 TaxID=1882752 RepID=UPI0009280354|nr:tRNA pseudouridine(55) synthase TruB [Singulisphaera sp. GP187]SIN79939.1 tRNA pseudouridine synthase B [Singulisphaera sp. GP187]
MAKDELKCAESGLLNLNKPGGMTSRDVVNIISRQRRGMKVGHAGTLDPLASGVLVVCLGKATRLIEYVQRMPKTYRTTVRLGAVSNTLDADGTVVEVEAPRQPSLPEIQAALGPLIGTVLQRPPEVSALKVGGKRAYDLARAGQVVTLEPRLVRIDRIDLLKYEWPRLDLEIACGSGTYVRSIARDVGEALGCGGLVEVLVRTRIGSFCIEEALDPLTLTAETLAGSLRSASEAVAALPNLAVTGAQVAELIQGRALSLTAFSGPPILAGEIALVGPDGDLAAIAEAIPESGSIVPRRVLATP